MGPKMDFMIRMIMKRTSIINIIMITIISTITTAFPNLLFPQHLNPKMMTKMHQSSNTFQVHPVHLVLWVRLAQEAQLVFMAKMESEDRQELEVHLGETVKMAEVIITTRSVSTRRIFLTKTKKVTNDNQMKPI